MPTYKTQALVLRKTKLAETDAIITLLSSDGLQLRCVAKGARKPGSRLGARLELYSVVDIMAHTGRSLDTITEARSVVDNAACRADVEHSAAAAVVVEVVDKVTRDANEEPLLYAMSLEALRCIGSSEGYGGALIAAACVLKVCSAIGYRPSEAEIADVSLVARTELAQEVRWVNTLLLSRFESLRELGGEEYQSIVASMLLFSQRWLQSHLDISLKSLDFLRKLL
jgi:DNA repair protein RecO (recombination protein O)